MVSKIKITNRMKSQRKNLVITMEINSKSFLVRINPEILKYDLFSSYNQSINFLDLVGDD